MVVMVVILLLLETLRFDPTQLLGTLATVALTMTTFLCCCACRTSSWHRIWHSSPESLRCSKVDHWLCSALISCNKALAAGYRRIFCAFLIWAALLHCCILQSQCQGSLEDDFRHLVEEHDRHRFKIDLKPTRSNKYTDRTYTRMWQLRASFWIYQATSSDFRSALVWAPSGVRDGEGPPKQNGKLDCVAWRKL